MMFMVVARFKNRDAKAIDTRLSDRGRMMPQNVKAEFRNVKEEFVALPSFGWVLRGPEACHPFDPSMNAGAWCLGFHQARLPAGSIRQRLVERRMEPARRGGLERPTAVDPPA